MGKLLKFLVWVLAICGVVIGVARAVAIRWWRVPANDPYLEASIAPTLRGGDLVILSRWSEPYAGDLVICPEPKTPERMTIGRVIGVGGDTITLQGSGVALNGHRVRTEGNCKHSRFSVIDPSAQTPVEQSCSREELGGASHERGDAASESGEPFTTTLESSQTFLLSDNRRFPWDSREFGPAARATCKETIVFRLVSAKGFWDVPNRFTLID